MYNFCTLFNINYLSRGVALYNSLEKTMNNFHLYVFAFDDKTQEILHQLKFSNLTVIPLKDFEDTELLKVKPKRTMPEYCWTCTSSTILYILNNFPAVDSCTYLDSDLYFYETPKFLLDEVPSNKSVLITAHRYSPEYLKQLINGKYCVQFMFFKNNSDGRKVLEWWRNKCLEWCFAWYENGKFGDQKYLDDWIERFDCVIELQHPGGGLAPWNIQQYDAFRKDNVMYIRDNKTNKTFQCIFYHFHGLKFFKNGTREHTTKTYFISENIKSILYLPYLEELDKIKKEINMIDSTVDPHGSTDWIKEVAKKIKKEVYNKIKKL